MISPAGVRAASPESRVLIRQGIADLQERKREEALKKFEAASQADPTDAEAVFYQGFTLNVLGRPLDALKHLARAKAMGYEEPRLTFQTGWALLGVGLWKEAVAALERYEQAHPGRGKTSEFLGRAYLALGEYDRAEAKLEEAIDKETYPEMEDFFADLSRLYREELADLGAAGCTYVQFDDTNLAYLCDPKMRENARALGEDPDELPAMYAALINDSIGDRPDGMAVCIHLCRGNAKSQWFASGGYEPVAEKLFNLTDVDGFFLEYDDDRSGGFEPLRFVPKGDKMIVLGLVTTKRGELESKDELKRRIEEASKYVDIDQLALSPQCGFSSNAIGNLVNVDDQRAKFALVREVAEEVWG